jgi:hypothetical protein
MNVVNSFQLGSSKQTLHCLEFGQAQWREGNEAFG